MLTRKLVAGLLLCALMSCGEVLNRSCLILICENNLKISLNGQDKGFILILKAANQPVKSISCPDKATTYVCDENSVLVRNYQPSEIQVTYYTSFDKIVTRTLKPIYHESEPNGAGCGTCRDGEVTLAL